HVVSNEDQGTPSDSAQATHAEPSQELRSAIASLREAWETSAENEKSAIFADSLADRYKEAGRFDSAAWFAGEAASFFDTRESWIRAGDYDYEAYTFALDPARQEEMAARRSEEHTSELQSRENLVCRLL